MDWIFSDLDFIIIFVDDIVILSKSEDDNMEHLRIVFELHAESESKVDCRAHQVMSETQDKRLMFGQAQLSDERD